MKRIQIKRKAYSYEVGFTVKKTQVKSKKLQLLYNLDEFNKIRGSRNY
jgi:hypothetical protein